MTVADVTPQGFELVEGELPLPRHLLSVMMDLEPGAVEMKPWAAELVEQRSGNRGLDDPETYSKPFSYTLTATITPDDDLLEFFCTDNELSSEHYQ